MDEVNTGIEMIEADFMARRTRRPDVAAAFDEAFALVAPARLTPQNRSLRAMGAAIVDAVSPGPVPEPEYHDRHHVVEAMLAMGLLCRAAVGQGLMDADTAMLGVIGMAGHDLGHDGAIHPGGVMEARSRDSVHAILSSLRPAPDPIALVVIDGLIAATDPALAADNAARALAAKPGPDAVLHHLANEADVCASLLPRLGPRLSTLLAEEWRNHANAAWQEVGTAWGRLGFLLQQPPFSAAAVSLGLAAARACCLETYAAAAMALGAGSSAAAGCTALDRLSPCDAGAVYREALSPLWPGPDGRNASAGSPASLL